MMFYKNTNAMVRSPGDDRDFFNIITGVLQDVLVPYLFIICLDNLFERR